MEGWYLEDVALWPDGTWCFREELEDYRGFMSDDYTILKMDSPEWLNLMDQEELGPNH
jgi:hypothetical protein